MPDLPVEPELDSDSLDQFRRGVEEFNSGKYFECHDTLEEVWQGMRGPARDFFQGLIQISVGFYHVRNGNLTGGESQLTKGLEHVAGYGDLFLGLELDCLRREVEPWLAGIRSGAISKEAPPVLPKLRLSR